MGCARFSSPAAIPSLRLYATLSPRCALRVFRPTRFWKRFKSVATTAGLTFDWDDVVRVSEEVREDDDPCDLHGYFEKVRLCNRGSEFRSQFAPFIVEDQIVGYVHYGFLDHLRQFEEVFTIGFGKNDCYVGNQVKLLSSLVTPEERTRAVGDAIKCLGELIPGFRNEAYGVHMNGYVEMDGQKFLWIGKRSITKQTFPGMLDHLVAGGLPHGISCMENLLKECEEEAGIPRSLSNSATPVGAISYEDIDGYRYKRDVLFCYDLKLPAEFTPKNEDGEVDSFKLVPVRHVANVIRRTGFFKQNCSLVIIDFLFRHGYVSPDNHGYLKLLQSLRSGDCS